MHRHTTCGSSNFLLKTEKNEEKNKQNKKYKKIIKNKNTKK